MEILILVVSIIVFWIPQNIVHEGSHAIVAKLLGAKITRFYPFPSYKLGKFTFAHIVYTYFGERDESWSLVYLAPVIANNILIAISISIFIIVYNSIWCMIPLAFAITNAADSFNNCREWIYKNDHRLLQSTRDLGKWRSLIGASVLEVRILCGACIVNLILAVVVLPILFFV